MKVTAVEVFECQINPKFKGWKPLIVKVETDEGIYGAGEVALAYGTGTSAGVGMVKNLAEKYLIGADPFRIEQLWETMYRRTFWGQGGGPVVYGGMSAIDEALWDIKGKALGVPVYELLGGKCHDRLRLYANAWFRGCGSPEEFAAAAERVVDDGYTAMKFDPFLWDPTGRRTYPPRFIARDLMKLAFNRVKAVREAVGPEIDIVIEGHGNMGPTRAIQMGQKFEELDPFFFEEPVDAMNVDAMKKVAENVNIPIAAGERYYTRYGFRQYIEQQVIDVVQPDVGLAGGISETRKIAAYAEIYGLQVQPHNCAGPVATAAAVQVDACIPNFLIQEWFPYQDPAQYQLVNEALEHQVVDGYLTVSDAPGLGVELNHEALALYPSVRVTG